MLYRAAGTIYNMICKHILPALILAVVLLGTSYAEEIRESSDDCSGRQNILVRYLLAV